MLSKQCWGNKLSGGIPTSIGRLVELTELELEGNKLTSSIPTEIGGLSKLAYLMIGPAQGQIGARGPGFFGFFVFLGIILADFGPYGGPWAQGPGPWAHGPWARSMGPWAGTMGPYIHIF